MHKIVTTCMMVALAIAIMGVAVYTQSAFAARNVAGGTIVDTGGGTGANGGTGATKTPIVSCIGNTELHNPNCPQAPPG